MILPAARLATACTAIFLGICLVWSSPAAQDWATDRPRGSPEVIGRYMELLRQDPLNERALEQLLVEYGPRGGASALAEHYSGLLSDRPDDVSLIVVLARLRAHELQPDGALALLDRSIELGFERAPVFLLRGRLRLETGDGDGALADYQQALLQTGSRDERLEILRATADLHRNRGRPELALESYRQMAQLDPDDAELRQELVEVLVGAGHLDEAVSQARALVDLAGTNTRGRADALGALARLLEDAGEYSEAVETWSRMIDLARTGHWLREEAEQGLVDCYLRWGRPDLLLEWVEQRLASHPRDAFALLVRARTLGRLGHIEESLGAWNLALERSSDRSEIPLEYAQVLRSLGRSEEALQILDHAMVRWPGHLGLLDEEVGLLMELSRPFDASYLVRNHEREFSGDVQALTYLVRLYQQIGDHSAAERLHGRIQEAHPDLFLAELQAEGQNLDGVALPEGADLIDLARETSNLDGYLDLVQALMEQGRDSAALLLVSEGRQRFPGSQELALANLELVEGQGIEAALTASREVLGISTTWDNAAAAFEVYYRSLGEMGLIDWALEDAAAEFGRSSLDIGSGRLLLMLQIREGHIAEASRTLSVLSAISRDGPDPREWALDTMERWPSVELLPFLSRLADADPSGSFRYELIGARLLAEGSRPQRARSRLQRLLQERGELPSVLFAIGEVWSGMSDPRDQSTGCWLMERALDGAQTHLPYRIGLIDCLRRQHKLEAAMEAALAGFQWVREPREADRLFDQLIMARPPEVSLHQIADELRGSLARANPSLLAWIEQRAASLP